MVELGDVTLTTADWGYAKPRELLALLAHVARDDAGPRSAPRFGPTYPVVS